MPAHSSLTGRPPKEEADSPKCGELREDGDEQYSRLNETDDKAYGEDKEALASFGDSNSAWNPHALSLGADVADEQGAHQGRSDVEPVNASHAETKQNNAVDVAI